MAVLRYARVATDQQSLDQQHDALTSTGKGRPQGLAALID